MSAEAKARIRAHEQAGRYIDVDGCRVFVREAGEGRPILLLHGVPASSYLYRKMLPLLAEAGWRAISFDFPGLGLSDKPRDLDYSWHGLAGWLGKVVRALDLEPLHLVVHDIGGPIGVEWAIENGERVSSLTLTNMPIDLERFSPPFPMGLFRVPVLRHVAVRLQSTTFFHAVMKRRGVYDASRLDKADTEVYLRLMAHGGGRRTFLEVMGGFVLTEAHGRRLREGLLSAPFPMQLVWGRHEIAIPQEQVDYIQTTFRLRHVHWVEARHFIQEDQPEACAEHIEAFCQEVDREGASR